MPSPKQVRYHYGRVIRLHDRLHNALIDAHNAGIIEYSGWDGVAPCQSHSETEKRIVATTQKALACAMRREILYGKKKS